MQVEWSAHPARFSGNCDCALQCRLLAHLASLSCCLCLCSHSCSHSRSQDDTSWNNMKKFLGARAVKDDIINYDARKITPGIRANVRDEWQDIWIERGGRGGCGAAVCGLLVGGMPGTILIHASRLQ